MASSVNQLLRDDFQRLHDMLKQYDILKRKLNELDMPHHERQVMDTARVMLREIIRNKTRDIKRRMREMMRYQ